MEDAPGLWYQLTFSKPLTQVMVLHKKEFSYFSFPDYLIKWIEIVYNDVESRLINNGYMSECFKIPQGL